MIRKAFFIFLFSFFCLSNFAAEVKIYGKAENVTDYVLRVKSFTDFISYRDTIVAETKLAEDGSFQFNIEMHEPQLLKLHLGFQTSSLYVEPGKSYQLKLIYDPEKERLSYLANNQLFMEFVDLPMDDLNNMISGMNHIMDRFLIKNYTRLYKYKQTHLIDTLRFQAMRLNTSGNNYFNELILFRLLDMEMSIKSKDMEMLFFKYLGNKTIRYEHYEYMLFFNTFFHDYLKTKTRALQPGQLRTLINQEDTPEALSTALKKDILLLNDQLRELVILRDLYYFFYDFEFKTLKVIQHLNYYKENSVYPEHKKIAANMLKRIKQLQPGSPMPEFALENSKGELKTNKDYKGKYLLLNFWELDCSDCFRNIDSLDYIQKTYADRVEVVAVSGKKYAAQIQQLIDEKELSLEFMLTAPDNRIYDDLKIRSLPAAILLDDKGNIYLYPAILPGRGYKNTFKAILK